MLYAIATGALLANGIAAAQAVTDATPKTNAARKLRLMCPEQHRTAHRIPTRMFRRCGPDGLRVMEWRAGRGGYVRNAQGEREPGFGPNGRSQRLPGACILAMRTTYSSVRDVPEETRMKVLVAYASRHGATQGIAEPIAQPLAGNGLEVTTQSADRAQVSETYDAYVIGSGAYAGHWISAASDFVSRNRAQLAA